MPTKKETDFKKWNQLNALTQGDVVKLTNGQTAEFVRLKQSKFLGKMNDKTYDIPVNMFVEVAEKVDLTAQIEKKKEGYMSLEKGDLFYISMKGNALLFEFDSMRNGQIMGRNPADNSLARIEPNLFEQSIKDLQKQKSGTV